MGFLGLGSAVTFFCDNNPMRDKTKKYQKVIRKVKKAARSGLKSWSSRNFAQRSFPNTDNYPRINYSISRRHFDYSVPQVIFGGELGTITLDYLKTFRNEKVKVYFTLRGGWRRRQRGRDVHVNEVLF
jgi:hypothetical protein